MSRCIKPGRVSVPAATVQPMDGTGYPLRRRKDGTVVQTAPNECPNGHPLRYPNVLVSFSQTKHMLGWLCVTCGTQTWQNGTATQEAVPSLS